MRWSALALALVVPYLVPHVAAAQSANGLLPDGTVLPARAIRFGLTTGWTRFDEFLGTGGKRNLAASLAVDSLGSRQLPSLAASETDIRAATALSNFRLNAGKLTAAANARIVTAPLIAEYGVTSRLTIGAVIPLVETRTTLIAQLNPHLGFANVGLNPAQGANATAVLAQNSTLVASLRSAATSLQQRVTLCQTTPADPSCSTINGQQSAAQTLIQSTTAFAAVLERLYGTNTTTHPGDSFVPLTSDPSQLAVTQQIAALGNQYKGFLNSSIITGTVAGAAAPAARDQLQALLAGFGHDSIQVADRASIGDISVGATYQLANSFTGDTSAASMNSRHYRVAVNGTFRIGTGEPANRNRFFDNNTGYGQHGIIGGIAADLQINRHWSGSAVGSYTHQLGTVDVSRIPNAANDVFPFGAATRGTYTAGDVMTASLFPHFRLSTSFSLDAQYSMVYTGGDTYALVPAAAGDTVTRIPPVAPYGLASGTAHQIGFGFSYSTVSGPDRSPGRLPFEVSFSHLETIVGSGGPVAKTFRDQIELKVFIRR